MADDRQKSLPEMYHDWAASTVDENGFEISHGLVIAPDGGMTVLALAVPPEQAYLVMIEQWDAGAAEMIFALDRYAQTGQGTTLGDLLAGFHFTREAAPRPFIIEYQFDPRIVKPIDWTNLWWTGALYREFNAILRKRLGISQL